MVHVTGDIELCIDQHLRSRKASSPAFVPSDEESLDKSDGTENSENG